MIVPYEQTTIQDLTVGIKAATPRESLNVASIINSDTGPVTRMSNSNQADLINNYLTGNTFSASDNETIQCLGAGLTSFPIDTIRVNNSPIRVGIGSLGSVVYTDENFNLINKVTTATIAEANSDPTVFYIVLSSNDNTPVETCYYLGDSNDIPEGITSNRVQLGSSDTKVTIANFFQYLQGAGLCTGYSSTISTINTGIVGGASDPAISSNIYDVEVTSENENINFYSFSESARFSTGDFIKIGNVTYVNMGLGTSTGVNLESYENPVKLYFNEDNPTSARFLAAILNQIYTHKNIQYPWGVSIQINMNLSSVEGPEGDSKVPTSVVITGDITPYITWDGTTKVLKSVNGVVPATNGRIIITNSDSTKESYYFGNLTPTPDDIHINGVACIEDFVLGIHEYKSKELLQTGSTISVTGAGGGAASLYYKTSSAPTITKGTSTSSAVIITLEASSNFFEIKHLTDDENKGATTYENQYIVIGNTCYYTSQRPDLPRLDPPVNTFVSISNLLMSTSEFLSEAYQAAFASFDLCATPDGLLVSGSHNILASDNISVSNLRIVDQTKLTDRFACMTRFPSTKDLFQYSYVANNDEFSTFTINYSFKSITGEIVISFDGAAVNGYGKSLYYENYNEGDNANDYIYILELNGSEYLNSFQSNMFGSQVLCLPPTEADYAAAMLKFMDYKDKAYQFVWDAGHCHPTLAKAAQTVANKIHAQFPISYPVEIKDVASALGYYESLGINDNKAIHLVPAHKNTYNGNFLSTVPASLVYIVNRVNAFNTSSQEFIPLFGSVKGICSAPNLVWNITDNNDPTKSELQLLLNSNINSIVRELSTTYIKSNATGQSETSYLSEDQNVYMTNILAQICDAYNPCLQGELNDSDLWSKITAELTDNINQRMIAGKKPKLNAFKVICDETLNTQTVIESRTVIYEVWVQYTPSVAYVKAYVQVVRLNTI
jgi:hypothetical protein